VFLVVGVSYQALIAIELIVMQLNLPASSQALVV
jgi:hypothetical protein